MTDFQIFGEPILFRLGPVPVTETMVSSTAVSAALLGIAMGLRSYTRLHPQSTVATITRLIIRSLESTVADIVGRPEPRLTVLAGSLFVFIAACNLAGQLPGVRPPTASLATTSALAIVVFFAVPMFGIASQGIGGYLLEYFRPNPLLFPLHLVSELSRTLALSFRLFGNIMSGHLLVALLISLSGFLVPMPFMALDLLIGLLQAYIFAILSTVFIGAAIGQGEKA
jgi:F-type H+-transporting ATPase subunit a